MKPTLIGSMASYEDRLMMDKELQMWGVGSPPESPREREELRKPTKNYVAQNPWLIAVKVVLSAVLVEEIGLRNKLGDVYIRYAGHTPFIILTPKILRDLITYPARILISKEIPTTRREVFVVAYTYLTLTIIISFCTSYLIA